MAPLSSVRQVSECFVRPMKVVEESKKPYHFSALEVFQITHRYMQVGLMFNKLALKQEDSCIKCFVNKIKDSLSSTLTHFYPLAGQLVTEVDEDRNTSCIFIDCNKGPGAKLIHAALDDITVSDIVSPIDIPPTVALFFDLGRLPINHDGHEIPLLTVQVTELVDGIFLGVSMNLTVADDASCWHFLTTLSETFKSNNDLVISRPPIYQDRLYPRGHVPIVTLPFIHPSEVARKREIADVPLREAVFHFTSQSMADLEAKVKEECGLKPKVSAFEALSAVVWRSIIRARNMKAEETTGCALLPNVRTVIDPPLTEDHFGNFWHPVIKKIKVGQLLAMTLGETALLLHEANNEQCTDEFVRNECLKWTEAPVFLSLPGPAFVVMSGSTKEDVYGIEFGMGKALSVYTCSNKHDGKVAARQGKEGKGSVSLEMCLSSDVMKALQEDKEFASLVSSKS